MMSLFSDRYKISLVLAAIFIVGTGVSLYYIYSLPNGLQLARGYEPEFSKVYLVIGLTFASGVLTLFYAMRYKKEVIVFRDRALEASNAQHDAEHAGKTTISLESVITTLSEADDEQDILQRGLHAICKQLDAGQGALYRVVEEGHKRTVELKIGYALSIGESTMIKYEFGEGLIGQSAANGNTLYVDDVPEGYVKIVSGLGSASPKYLLIVPIKRQDQVLGILEIASFLQMNEDQRRFVEEAAELIAEKISMKHKS
jgi:transcriptional regulator with GAF, ATPase, and Fis domain